MNLCPRLCRGPGVRSPGLRGSAGGAQAQPAHRHQHLSLQAGRMRGCSVLDTRSLTDIQRMHIWPGLQHPNHGHVNLKRSVTQRTVSKFEYLLNTATL